MLSSQFAGCLLGGMIGDIAGAVVEAESPGYIRKTFKSVDDMLALEFVEEILNQKWTVGRFTDDTQMTLCVAEWLLEDAELGGKELLARFSEAYRPARRYGPSAARILESFPEHQQEWASLATVAFPDGSYGNGSAMRVSPIGCFFYDDRKALMKAANVSSRVTHTHTQAIQGATLQAGLVSAAVRALTVEQTLQELSNLLKPFANATVFEQALAQVAEGLKQGLRPSQMTDKLGTGTDAKESVPMAIYCYLANLDSYEDTLKDSIFLGGDTDTIACMAGSASGARLGQEAIPRRWLAKVREETYTPGRVLRLAQDLHKKHVSLKSSAS
jgi:ADP-ribosylglycohydrolase